ncbi:MAG: citrate synthase [Thermodesulfobacteriota bacterium]
MSDSVKLVFNDHSYELPLIQGSEGEQAIDISALRRETGLITYDPGYPNTGSCKSNITFMDGEQGILRYRGIPIEQLAEHSTFIETAYLLIYGELPTRRELTRFSVLLNDHSLIHRNMLSFFDNFPRRTHPMGILSSMVTAMRGFYPELTDQSNEEERTETFARIISKIRTMAAVSYKLSLGHEIIYPRPDLTYVPNFLNMMFDSPVRPYRIDPDIVRALEVFWILHADHEQNCSTAAVRLVGSARVNIYAALSAGISALWGPLHGGANQAVVEMLEQIKEQGGDPAPFVQKAKDRNDPFRLFGFGHRVYKTYDPRTRIMKKVCHRLLNKLKLDDPLLDIAMELEESALNDPYFVDNNLYPNVDFYSGIVLRAIGIPLNMFTVMFAIGRLPGWVSQWKESIEDPQWRLHRPRQIYTGPRKRDYVHIDERDHSS